MNAQRNKHHHDAGVAITEVFELEVERLRFTRALGDVRKAVDVVVAVFAAPLAATFVKREVAAALQTQLAAHVEQLYVVPDWGPWVIRVGAAEHKRRVDGLKAIERHAKAGAEVVGAIRRAFVGSVGPVVAHVATGMFERGGQANAGELVPLSDVDSASAAS